MIINKLKSLYDQFREMGSLIDDKELAMTLLGSLPDDYKPLITALDAVGEDKISYEKVKGMLLNDIARDNDTKSGNSEDALAVRRNNYNFNGRCHNCNEQGHYARNCPVKAKKFSNVKNYDYRNSNSGYFVQEATNLKILIPETPIPLVLLKKQHCLFLILV